MKTVHKFAEADRGSRVIKCQ